MFLGMHPGRNPWMGEKNHMHLRSTTSLRRTAHTCTCTYGCAHTHIHTHMCTICIHTGRFPGQLCGGQSGPHRTRWEGQAQPDGLHLCVITTHQASWTKAPKTLERELGKALPQDKHTTWSPPGCFFKADCPGNSQVTGPFSL